MTVQERRQYLRTFLVRNEYNDRGGRVVTFLLTIIPQTMNGIAVTEKQAIQGYARTYDVNHNIVREYIDDLTSGEPPVLVRDNGNICLSPTFRSHWEAANPQEKSHV